jgi:hypothetical protein
VSNEPNRLDRSGSGPADANGGEPGLPSPFESAGALERRRRYELTPAEKAQRRKNRRWLLIAVPAVLLGGAALVAAVVADRSSSSVRPLAVPAGYKAVSDGVFAYAVPSSWSTSSLYSDNVGDLDTAGTTGWVAEHVDTRAQPPSLGEAPPAVFRTFGQEKPTPFQLGRGQPVEVTGADTAFRYEMTRPGGFQAVALDIWQAGSGAELWLLVHSSPATTAQILATIRA